MVVDDRGPGGGVGVLGSTPVLVVALWVVWSSAFVAIKIGLRHSSPDVFTVLRVVAALVILLGAALSTRRPTGLRDPRIHRYGVLLGLTNVAGFLVFQNLGLLEAPIGVGSMLLYTQPFLVALGAWALRGERLSPPQVGGMAVGWVGVVVVVAGEVDVGATPVRAVLFLLLGAMFWAAGTLLFTAVPPETSVLSVLLLMNVYGLVPILAVLGIGAARGSAHADWGPVLVVMAVWAGAGASIGGLGLQFLLLRRGKAGVVSSWTFAVPVLAAALGVLVLDETAHATLLAGGAAVALGIWLVNRRGGVSGPSARPPRRRARRPSRLSPCRPSASRASHRSAAP